MGGLRRLVDNGAYFPDCRHLASSFPSSSLATLATGAWPAQHGIVADSWYDRRERGRIRATADAMLATTLAAQVVPSGRVYVVSLDPDKGEILAGTPLAHRFWMGPDGQFTGGDDSPAWLADYTRDHPVSDLHNADWLAMGARSGAPALRTLKYDPARPQDFFRLYQASPFCQGAQLEFAGELVGREKLGQGNTFDMVCVVASSASLLGYETGGRSPLMEQMTLQLDRQMGALLDQLDRTVGKSMYDFVLAGAHGAPPDPLSFARPRMAVPGESLAQAIQRKLVQNKAGRLEKYVYPFLYLEAPAGQRAPESAALAAARAAMDEEAVAGYFTAGGACSVHDDWERRFRNSFHPARSGDVMLSYQPEYVEDYGTPRGVSYGSLYNYDVQVPLCFYGPQFRAGVFEAPVESVDLAPTLARAIGVAAPSSSAGRVLGQAFVGSEDPIR